MSSYKLQSVRDPDDEIEEAIERAYKQRISLPGGLSIVYRGDGTDTVYQLRYILFCLNLCTTGTSDQLNERILSNGIRPEEAIHDPKSLAEKIASSGLESCPMYVFQVYLKKNGLSMNGLKQDLVKRVKEDLEKKNGSIFSMNQEDKKHIARAIRAISHRQVPTEDEICVMEQHGYRYDAKYNTFFNMITCKKIIGKNGFWENIWFMTYSKPLGEKTIIVDFV